jgi:hypothetical protein
MKEFLEDREREKKTQDGKVRLSMHGMKEAGRNGQVGGTYTHYEVRLSKSREFTGGLISRERCLNHCLIQNGRMQCYSCRTAASDDAGP